MVVNVSVTDHQWIWTGEDNRSSVLLVLQHGNTMIRWWNTAVLDRCYLCQTWNESDDKVAMFLLVGRRFIIFVVVFFGKTGMGVRESGNTPIVYRHSTHAL